MQADVPADVHRPPKRQQDRRAPQTSISQKHKKDDSSRLKRDPLNAVRQCETHVDDCCNHQADSEDAQLAVGTSAPCERDEQGTKNRAETQPEENRTIREAA